MKKIKLEKGITLIALIITIIILLILAVVTIGSIKNSNIITYAKNASNAYEEGKENENTTLKEYEDEISKYYSNEGVSNNVPVTNPEENPTAWDMAYSYNGSTWTKSTGGGNVEGQIVAKFYKKNVPVAPDGIYLPDAEGKLELMPVNAQEYSYRLVIEGSGNMPAIGDMNTKTYVAWQTAILEGFTQQSTQNMIMPYVTEIVICDGITSIGAWAFTTASGIQKVTLPNTLKKIGTYAFANGSLSNIQLPDSVSEIEDYAFQYSKLQEIRIPASVIKIGYSAFEYCDSLASVYIESTSDLLEIYDAFDDISKDAIIYVRNPGIAAKVAAVTSRTISTDYNWK